ncbi:MAG: hypothetical protein WB005_23685, partial [Pseudolabrys sp.]
MTNITMGLEETEGDILAFEVSDHVLESGGHGEGEGELYPWGLHRPVRVPGLTGLIAPDLISERPLRGSLSVSRMSF